MNRAASELRPGQQALHRPRPICLTIASFLFKQRLWLSAHQQDAFLAKTKRYRGPTPLALKPRADCADQNRKPSLIN